MSEPVPTGRRVEDLKLTGLLIPWTWLQPAFVQVPESPRLYIPLFSDKELLDVVMRAAKVPYAKVVEVTEVEEFLASIPSEVGLMVDPYFTVFGKFRYLEVQRP